MKELEKAEERLRELLNPLSNGQEIYINLSGQEVQINFYGKDVKTLPPCKVKFLPVKSATDEIMLLSIQKAYPNAILIVDKKLHSLYPLASLCYPTPIEQAAKES